MATELSRLLVKVSAATQVAIIVNTSHEWINKLAAMSAGIAKMQLAEEVGDASLNEDAFNLANCDIHCRLITRAIDELVHNNFSSVENAATLLRELVTRNTYGAFAEISIYDWMTRCHVAISTQVPMTSNDVLSSSGSIVDGKIDFYGSYFDIKAFGFNGRLAQRLKARLENEIPDREVLIEDSWDISVDTFRDLIADARQVAAELRQSGYLKRGHLRIRLDDKKPVTVSMRSVDPYRLAKENALLPFKSANQFTKNMPFILIFAIHPWFNSNSMQIDFAGVDTVVTRSLARRAFIQFSGDKTPLDAICANVPADATLSDASHLLSAIFFVNVFPVEADPKMKGPLPSWLYLNPRATHRITRSQMGVYRSINPHGTTIDDFADDDY